MDGSSECWQSTQPVGKDTQVKVLASASKVALTIADTLRLPRQASSGLGNVELIRKPTDEWRGLWRWRISETDPCRIEFAGPGHVPESNELKLEVDNISGG
jgi:hypothetical protein